jgi:hypothetical protein
MRETLEYIDYPDDPEKLHINTRLALLRDTAGFYADSRRELSEASALADNFPGSIWEHLGEVKGHQDKALKRVKASEAAVATLVYEYKESAENAVENVYTLEDFYRTVTAAHIDTTNSELGLAAVTNQENKKAVLLATRYRDLKLFAKQGRELGFNPLNIDYFESGSEFIEQRVAKAFASKALPEIADFLLEVRQDQLNRAVFHTDVLKFCRRLKEKEAAKTAGETVRHLVKIFPVPTTLDSIQTMAAVK